MQRQVVRKGGEYLFCPKKGCITSSRLSLVEQGVLDALQKHFEKLCLKVDEVQKKPNQDYSAVLQTAEQELQNVQKQINRLHDLLEQGVYTIDTFLSRQKTLMQKQNEIRDSLEAIRKKQAARRQPDYSAMCQKIQYVLETYRNCDRQKQNQLLKSVIATGVYSKEKGSGPNGFQVDLTIKPLYL